MPAKPGLIVALTTIFLAGEPSLARSQSLNDLFKLVSSRSSASDLISTIKSISDVTIGQIDPGNAPENAEGKVILYRTATCPYCKRAAAYMREHKVGFVERDIEKNANYRAELARLRSPGVPTLVFADKTMVGFDETKFERNYAEFKQAPATQAAAPGAPQMAVAAIQSGDVLLVKIPNVAVYNRPAKSERIAALGKTDEIVFMGDESNGYYRVTTAQGEGWVDKFLVKKK